MKRFWKYIVTALALPLFTVGCETDYPEPNESGLPQASEIDVTITVDQETNYVTFTLNNKGWDPLWIFGEVKIDGSVNKRYAYTQNGASLRFRDAGAYSVEVKARNANGISVGSKVCTFELQNDWRDPLWDATDASNLWLNADPEITFWFANDSWIQISDPVFENNGDSYTVTIPDGIGGSQWQGQTTFLTKIGTESSKHYDFQVILNSTANNSAGVTIKLQQDGDDNLFYFDDRHPISAGENYVYRVANFEGKDCTALKLNIDFGGCPAGSTCEIKEIIFCEHLEGAE